MRRFCGCDKGTRSVPLSQKCGGVKHHKGRSPTGVLRNPTEGSAYNPVMRSNFALH